MLPRIIVMSVLFAVFAPFVDAQTQDPISWNLDIVSVKKPLVPGDHFNVLVTARIEPGWHLYSTAQPPGGPVSTKISISSEEPFMAAGDVESPVPVIAYDRNFGIETEFFMGSAGFTLKVLVKGECPPGKQQLRVNVRYQTCNDRLCLPARTLTLEALVEVSAGSVAPAVSNHGATATEKSPSPATGGKSHGNLLSFLWLAMCVGALSLLTPCVFPMIPITVSYFTSHSADSRRVALFNASVFSGGIILAFTGLGMVIALLFGASGINQFAANPWVNLLITLIFLLFAMVLFGRFQIRMPSGLVTAIDGWTRREKGGRIIGVLLMGLIFTLTSFTCTAPFIGTLLVLAAAGEWVWPLLGMFTFSTVFATPFFLLALIPQMVSRLPRSGVWLNSVKVVMGLLEIAAAMKFLSNADIVWHWGVFTREAVIACWSAVAGLAALYLLGKFRMPEEPPVEGIGAARLITAICFLTLGIYLFTGLFGKRLGEIEAFLPPPEENEYAGANVESGGLPWIINDYEEALDRAGRENRLLLIDFTGYTCTNCRWMESNMFPRADVRKELEKHVRLKLYTDGEGEIYKKNQRLEQEKFGTVALPYYALVDINGNLIAGFAGLTRDMAEFIDFLKSSKKRSQLSGAAGS